MMWFYGVVADLALVTASPHAQSLEAACTK